MIVKDPRTGKGKMLRLFLDSGCTKFIILRKFTSPKTRTKLKEKTVSNTKHTKVNSHLVLKRQ